MKPFKTLPKTIRVHVVRGSSGALLATLTDFDVFTEADNLNDLFFQVNDLIVTLFDVPKKYQNETCYIPDKNTQQKLIKIASSTTTTISSNFNINKYISSLSPKDINHNFL